MSHKLGPLVREAFQIVFYLTTLAIPALSQRIPVPPTGILVISCRLDDAPYQRGKIFVDGREAGACPGATVQTSTGAHSVRAGEAIGNDHYLAYQNERVEVEKDITQNVIANLVPNTAGKAAGLAYALGARQVEIDRLQRPDDTKIGALSPDAKILAIGSETNSVRLYDATNGVSLRRLGEPGAYWVSFVTALAFGQDGNLLASSGWQYDKYIGEINIWDTGTGRRLLTIPGVKEVSSLALSPDGRLLAAGVGTNELKVWNASNGALLWSVRPPGKTGEKISQLVFSGDSKLLIAGPSSGENISVYSVPTAKQLSTLRGNLVTLGKGDKAFTFSYRGYDDTLRSIWHLPTGKLIESRLLKGTPAVRALNEQVVIAQSGSANVLDSRNEPLMRALNNPAQIILAPEGRRLIFYHDAGVISSLPAFPCAEHAQETPTVGFCEMVRNPQLYFDKQVRVRATYEMATEAQYLRDENCPLSHDQQIGAGYSPLNEKQLYLLNTKLRQIGERDYGGRALVTLIGVLRNSSRHDFAWYQYRFDIISVEDMAPVVVPYKGELQGAVTYVARVRAGTREGPSLVPALRMLENYAIRIEWINLDAFPELKDLGRKEGDQEIVFTVLSDEIKQMTERRWNRTIKCKILRIN